MATIDSVRPIFELDPDEVVADLDRGLTLPARLYADPEVHRLEMERIFSRCWQYLCHECKLRNAGDVVVGSAGEIPVLVIRQPDGELRGFVNACRHRLHPVATENRTECKVLQCPYHGWSYGLDGRLRGVPRKQLEPALDTDSIALIPISVESWDQWVFVNPDPDAAPLASLTHEVSQRAAELNRDLAEFQFVDRYEYEMDCDWKIWAENLIECYHCPTLHRCSFGKAYESRPDQYQVEAWEDTGWHQTPIKWLPNGIDPAQCKGFRFTYLWPTSFFAADDFVGFVGAVVPLTPGRCWAYVDMYAPPDGDPEITEQWLKLWDETLEEDKLATNRQQHGYRSGLVGHGQLMPNGEASLTAFMRRTWRALSE
ncbi:MAG TPA: aromatic ring-hydroxylating dioxygenase subunit alpha [Solirubrobacteraceae bacterium]|nr:aromatic ring-hydroxylating dioxygenase subunit alpha [Solirubrobacteraceae bacterium]